MGGEQNTTTFIVPQSHLISTAEGHQHDFIYFDCANRLWLITYAQHFAY